MPGRLRPPFEAETASARPCASGLRKMETRKEYRIFISSPSDVAAERQRVERVVARLGGEIGGAAKLTVIRWEIFLLHRR